MASEKMIQAPLPLLFIIGDSVPRDTSGPQPSVSSSDELANIPTYENGPSIPYPDAKLAVLKKISQLIILESLMNYNNTYNGRKDLQTRKKDEYPAFIRNSKNKLQRGLRPELHEMIGVSALVNTKYSTPGQAQKFVTEANSDMRKRYYGVEGSTEASARVAEIERLEEYRRKNPASPIENS